MSGFIYAIGNGDLVKIGWSIDPNRRLAALQTGSPESLVLLGVVAGTRQAERDAHLKLGAWRVRGEWFKIEGDVAGFVGSLEAAPAAPAISESRVSPLQSRCARGFLSLTKEGLARLAGVSLATIMRFEHGKGSPEAKTADAIESALARAGVEFIRREDGAEGVVVRTTAAP